MLFEADLTMQPFHCFYISSSVVSTPALSVPRAYTGLSLQQFLLKGSWIQLCLSWRGATRSVEQPDKLILGWRRLFLSDENVTILSHSLSRPAIPGTQLCVGGYSVILECTHTHTGSVTHRLRQGPFKLIFWSNVLQFSTAGLKASPGA